VARPRYDVHDRTVLITGGARGIGLASARLLAQRGARLALLDVDEDELKRQATLLNAAWAACDVSDPGAVNAAVEDVVDRLEGIDVVFANAGVESRLATVLSADPEAWRRVVDVNLHGVFHTVKATVAHVVARRGYMLLNASMYAFMNGALASDYAVSKAGVEQLGKALRTELRPHGAAAGVAYFGFIDTALVERTIAQPAADRLRKALPGFFTSPIAVDRAAAAIVAGIERRSAKVMQPRWIPVLQALRGVLGPLDERTAADPKVHEAIRLADNAGPDRAKVPHV
jgi:NAD(P)-dependent dehydrogenase (short-subunit alcohol dehydrogenase family)